MLSTINLICFSFFIVITMIYLHFPMAINSQTDKISIFEVINSSYYITGNSNKIEMQKANISDAISNLIINHITALDKGTQNTNETSTNEFTVSATTNSSEIPLSASSIKEAFEGIFNESLTKALNSTDISQNALKVGPFHIWRCTDNQSLINWTCILP